MTTITLPTLPLQTEVRPRYVSFAADLTPALGGPMQRINRLGDRYALDVTLPRLAEDDARAWVAARAKARATGATLLLAWPKVAALGSIGTPLINGASQTGTSLIADGFTPGAVIKPAQFFSFLVGTRTYLHQVTDQVTANGSGQATLSIAPMLRNGTTDNNALSFAAPNMEGFIVGSAEDWDVDFLTTYGLSFSLIEVE